MESKSSTYGHLQGMKPDASFLTSVMLLSFVTLGKYIVSYAKGKAASALQTLMELQPLFASRVVLSNENDILDEGIDISSLQTEEVNIRKFMWGITCAFYGKQVTASIANKK